MTMVTDWHVYNINRSVVASGLPMRDEYDEKSFIFDTHCANAQGSEVGMRHVARSIRLGSAPAGSGHDNYLSGILVSMNVTASIKWWQQAQRYHFFQIISSMSTMHKLRSMLKHGTIVFHPATAHSVIEAFKLLLDEEDKISDAELAYSCPSGLLLTAAVATNYLQLKTMWNQRRGHKLPEWQEFCDWIECLPGFVDLVGIAKDVPVKKEENV